MIERVKQELQVGSEVGLCLTTQPCLGSGLPDQHMPEPLLPMRGEPRKTPPCAPATPTAASSPAITIAISNAAAIRNKPELLLRGTAGSMKMTQEYYHRSLPSEIGSLASPTHGSSVFGCSVEELRAPDKPMQCGPLVRALQAAPTSRLQSAPVVAPKAGPTTGLTE
jgi:hypothetical protein